MKTPILSLICLACILNASAVTMHAQTPDMSTDSTTPSYDMKAQALLDLQAVNKKCVDLAEVLPSDKLTWRPSPDTRSFAEVFLHVAGERYAILSMMGANPPAGFKAREFEKSTTEKDRIVEDLNQSWDFANKTINSMSNADFAKLLPKLGPQANEGDVFTSSLPTRTNTSANLLPTRGRMASCPLGLCKCRKRKRTPLRANKGPTTPSLRNVQSGEPKPANEMVRRLIHLLGQVDRGGSF